MRESARGGFVTRETGDCTSWWTGQQSPGAAAIAASKELSAADDSPALENGRGVESFVV